MAGRIVGWVISGLLMLGVIGYIVLGVFWGDKLPGGTTILGVDVSHMTSDEAQQKLGPAVAGIESKPIQVTIAGVTNHVVPKDAGLSINLDDTLRQSARLDLTPSGMREKFDGGKKIPVLTSVDSKTTDLLVKKLQANIPGGPVNGKLAIKDAAVVRVPAKQGVGLVTARVTGELLSKWLSGANQTTPVIALPTQTLAPDITDETMDNFINQVVNPAWVKPVNVKVGAKTHILSVADIKQASLIKPTDTGFDLGFNGDLLLKSLTVVAKKDGVANFGEKPKNATFDWTDGKLVGTEGAPGTGVDPTKLAVAVLAGVKAPDHTTVVDVTTVNPRVTVAGAAKLGIKELVSEFSTPTTSDEDRTHNLVTVAGALNGQLVMPGEVFSMNAAAGPYNADQGYRAAGVINSGVFSKGVGGGVSQMGTTLYNAGFFAGLEDVQHQAHSLYISRYPMGREATINYDNLDVKFKNDTNTAILIKSFVADEKLTVQFFGTKHWDITTTTSARYDFTEARDVESRVKGCMEDNEGSRGFKVDVVREWHKVGDPAIVRTEKKTTTYDPTNRVKCLDQ